MTKRKNWKLEERTDNLRQYVEHNALDNEDAKQDRRDGDRADNRQEKLLFGNGQKRHTTKCVYCGNENHKSFKCSRVLRVADRREILRKSKLCYNCTGKRHTASKCWPRNCIKCKQKHHASLCDERVSTMMDTHVERVFYSSETYSSEAYSSETYSSQTRNREKSLPKPCILLSRLM